MQLNSRITAICLATIASLILVAPANAIPQVLPATQDFTPGYESSFNLDFGGGFQRSAFISQTNYELEIDAEPVGGAARFLSYTQSVDSIDMPNPLFGQVGQPEFLPTGAISVSIVPGTSGASSYLLSGNTGEFSTTESYLISWTEDLTNLGLGTVNGGSLEFPSTSQGTIEFLTQSSGRINQVWSGVFEPLGLTYTCFVNTTFVPEPASLSLLAFGAMGLIRRRRMSRVG